MEEGGLRAVVDLNCSISSNSFALCFDSDWLLLLVIYDESRSVVDNANKRSNNRRFCKDEGGRGGGGKCLRLIIARKYFACDISSSPNAPFNSI